MPTKVPETPTSQALKKSAVARYLQLASLFRARIESGEWEVDSRIPTVEELARDCGVATMTIRQALDILEAEGLIERGGGHKMAAGLTLTRDQLEPAMDRLGALLARQGAGAMGPRELRLHGVLMPGAVTPELIERIEAAGPFGAGASAPRFAFPDMGIGFARPVGQNHLKLAITDGLGGKLEAIAFNAFAGELGPALANHAGARFHFAGELELNHWNGRVTPQLRLADAAPA